MLQVTSSVPVSFTWDLGLIRVAPAYDTSVVYQHRTLFSLPTTSSSLSVSFFSHCTISLSVSASSLINADTNSFIDTVINIVYAQRVQRINPNYLAVASSDNLLSHASSGVGRAVVIFNRTSVAASCPVCDEGENSQIPSSFLAGIDIINQAITPSQSTIPSPSFSPAAPGPVLSHELIASDRSFFSGCSNLPPLGYSNFSPEKGLTLTSKFGGFPSRVTNASWIFDSSSLAHPLFKPHWLFLLIRHI